MATAATPKGSTHNTSTPKVSQVPAGQAAPDASPHSGSGAKATAKGSTHNVSTPKRSVIPTGQRRPDESPHA
jgi:hypothetical protein